jgi:hypothetical protein
MSANNAYIEFRLHSEGSNEGPRWGIAFRHKKDLSKVFDPGIHPHQIDIEFPDEKCYTFGIRPSFWTVRRGRPCLEFVDAQAIDSKTSEKRCPVKELAIDKLGYDVDMKNRCNILVEVIEKNSFLKIVKFE